MLSHAVPVVEADWEQGQEEAAARYFSFGPRVGVANGSASDVCLAG